MCMKSTHCHHPVELFITPSYPLHQERVPSPLTPLPRPRQRHPLLITALIVLLTVGSIVLIPLMLSPLPPTTNTIGTLSFANSGQYTPTTSAGYSDIVTLSLSSLPAPDPTTAYFAWLMADQTDALTPPLLLGHLPLHADGSATLSYASADHSNLLAHYSGLRITEQAASSDPASPSRNPQTWRWQGWLPQTPNPSDENHYSFLSHLRHLLSGDPALQDNQIPGGLMQWTTRNVAQLEICSNQAQSIWGASMSDANAELIHHNLLCILDYIDGQSWIWQDVPPHSPWAIDPLAGKLGLLSSSPNQEPPSYLPHIDIHLTALAASPGVSSEQQAVATQADGVVKRMIEHLTQVRQNARELVKATPAQLRQPQALTLLNQITALVTALKDGGFDPATGTNIGGTLWLAARIQQMATVALQPSSA